MDQQYDKLHGQRVHSWVLVLPGCHGVSKPFFIEPSTGRRKPLTSTRYLGIESLWNHKNLWVNMQPCPNGIQVQWRVSLSAELIFKFSYIYYYFAVNTEYVTGISSFVGLNSFVTKCLFWQVGFLCAFVMYNISNAFPWIYFCVIICGISVWFVVVVGNLCSFYELRYFCIVCSFCLVFLGDCWLLFVFQCLLLWYYFMILCLFCDFVVCMCSC